VADEKENKYFSELKKFERKQVIAKDTDGNEFKGECMAINYMHLNVVLMTDKEKIIIRNLASIRRDRTFK